MKLSILVVLTALFIFVSGFENPAIFFIGYLWTSVLYPTAFVTTFVPLSMIFGISWLIGYFFIDKSNTGKLPLVFYLTIAFAVWITFTTLTAAMPVPAWSKWNWAIQSILITVACPLLIRTRAQIETAFIAALSAFSAHVMTGGIKSLLGTAGYDRLGRLMMSNNWLGETSTLALAAVITIPMTYYVIKHSVIFESYRGRLLFIAFCCYTVFAVECVIGTSARTGVITFGALLLFGVKSIFRKILVIAGAVGLFYVAQPYLNDKSMSRFSTIATYQTDSSAATRLAVWQWAMRYVEEHPLGGGFTIFTTSSITYQAADNGGRIVSIHETNRAAHSIYFEVLAEQGYPGEFLFLAILVSGLWGTWWISRMRPGETEHAWIVPFGRVLFVCITLFCFGAAFVGIAYQPLVYLFLGLYCSLYRWVWSKGVTRARFSARPKFYATPA